MEDPAAPHCARHQRDGIGCVRMCAHVYLLDSAWFVWQVVTEMCFVVRQAAGEWELDHRCAQAEEMDSTNR